MEKQNNKILETPERPLQVTGTQPDESAVHRALGTDSPKQDKPDDVGTTRKWKFPALRNIPYRQKKLFKSGTQPEKIEHVPHGKNHGCICAECMVARGDFEDIPNESHAPVEQVHIPPVADLHAEQDSKDSGDKSDSIRAKEFDALYADIIDEETAGILLDTFRKAGETYVIGKNFGKNVESIWKQDEKELLILGKLGKRAWEAEANIPKFKHKELVILGVFLTQGIALRVAATLKIVKDEKKS